MLQNGSVLEAYELVYETYGQLNTEKSNALLICHALSGHHHAAGLHHQDDAKPGWWDAYRSGQGHRHECFLRCER